MTNDNNRTHHHGNRRSDTGVVTGEYINVTVYKGQRKADTYLYVPEASGTDDVPGELLDLLGPLEKVLSIELHEQRKLAQANVVEVIKQVTREGYYLQLPPQDLRQTPA